MNKAFLDTCVLWPNRQRDILLSLAVESCYRPLWSDAVLRELEYISIRKREAHGDDGDSARHRTNSLLLAMRREFPESEIVGWEHLEGTFHLRDANDEHVLAAAVTGRADVLVTSNTRDFPQTQLPSSMKVATPGAFTAMLATLNTAACWRAVHAIVQRSGVMGPRISSNDLLEQLSERYGMVEFVELLRSSPG